MVGTNENAGSSKQTNRRVRFSRVPGADVPLQRPLGEAKWRPVKGNHPPPAWQRRVFRDALHHVPPAQRSPVIRPNPQCHSMIRSRRLRQHALCRLKQHGRFQSSNFFLKYGLPIEGAAIETVQEQHRWRGRVAAGLLEVQPDAVDDNELAVWICQLLRRQCVCQRLHQIIGA